MNELYILGENNPNGIGPNCSLLRIHEDKKPTKNIMFDCGFAINNNVNNARIFNGLGDKLKKALEEPELELVSELIPPNLKLLQDMGIKIDALIASHAHFDHAMAAILTLIGHKKDKENTFGKLLSDNARVWGSPATLKLMTLQIIDDLMGKKSKCKIGVIDLVGFKKRYNKLVLGEQEILPGQKIFVFHPGHIHGAASVIVKLPNGENAAFLSDTSFSEQILIGATDTITDVVPYDWLPHYILNTDLTYGRKNREEKNYNSEFKKFKSIVAMTAARGGKTLVGAFRIARGQNAAVGLAPLLSELGIPLYCDGGIRKVFNLLLELQKEPWSDKEKMFSLDGINMVKNYDRTTGHDHRQELIESDLPMVIISTSGMLSHGPIRGSYLIPSLQDERNTIVVLGYQTPDSIGYELLKIAQSDGKEKKIILDGKEIIIRAEIQGVELSAHSPLEMYPEKYYEPILRARNGQKMKLCILLHGEQENKKTAFKEYAPYFKKIIIPGTAKTQNDVIIF